METKFTPGPWIAHESESFGTKLFYIAQADGAPYTSDASDVCDVRLVAKRESTWIADAHLIAAAPNLYNELENICSWLKRMSQLKWEDESYAPKFKQSYENAMSVLKEARGE